VLIVAAALLQSAAGTPAHASPITGHGTGTGTGHIGIRLLEAPTNRRQDPRARIYIVDHLSPGTTIRRRIEVSSTSSKPQHVELYAAAAGITHGRFILIPGRPQNELSTWTSLDHPALDLPPHGQATVRVTIKVPRTASPGEQYGVIWAQNTAKPNASHNVGMVNAVGIRMYLDIGPGGEAPSDFQIDKLTPMRDGHGRPELVIQVHNTGGRALDMSGSLSLSDGPLTAGPFAATSGVTLARGDTAPVTIVLYGRVPNGPWKMRLTLQSGMVKKTLTSTVTFPASGIGKPVAMSVPLPIPLLLAGLAVLIALAAALTNHRRTHMKRAKNP